MALGIVAKYGGNRLKTIIQITNVDQNLWLHSAKAANAKCKQESKRLNEESR